MTGRLARTTGLGAVTATGLALLGFGLGGLAGLEQRVELAARQAEPAPRFVDWRDGTCPERVRPVDSREV